MANGSEKKNKGQVFPEAEKDVAKPCANDDCRKPTFSSGMYGLTRDGRRLCSKKCDDAYRNTLFTPKQAAAS